MNSPKLLPHGVHSSVPFADYCLDPGVNASTLKAFMGRTPKHAKVSLAEDKDSESLTVGHASHTAVLEPDEYDKLYAVFPYREFCETYGDGRTKAHKEAKAAWEAEHAHAIRITDDEHQKAMAIREAVLDHPIAKRLLIDNKGKNELTLICDDGKTRRKARLDRVTKWDGWPAIVDLKTINTRGRCLSDYVISRYMLDYGVHMQLAWYLGCLADHDANAEKYKPLIVFVENEEPYDVRVVEVSARSIEQGRLDAAACLQQYQQATETGYWPGMPHQVDGVDIPEFAIENQVNEEVFV